jgi:hypothetical protein
VQAAQLLALVVVPPLADLLSLGGLVLFLWLLTAFVAEVHSFASMGRVFAGIIGSLILLAMGLAILVNILFGGPGGR